jgi:hypothetical protein
VVLGILSEAVSISDQLLSFLMSHSEVVNLSQTSFQVRFAVLCCVPGRFQISSEHMSLIYSADAWKHIAPACILPFFFLASFHWYIRFLNLADGSIQ